MQGEVVYLYAFDVANEIKVTEVRQILREEPIPFEIRADHTLPKDLPVYRPLTIERTLRTATRQGQPVRTFIRVYEVGVVSVVMRVPVVAGSLSELIPYHQPVFDDGTTFDQAARRICDEVTEGLRDVLVQASPGSDPEAYTVFCLSEIGESQDVCSWLHGQQREVAALLTETATGHLSEMQVDEVIRLSRSFARTDAVVVDWDAALIVDLDGYYDDVLYVLELANLQLEEYKMLDGRLDAYLDRSYEHVKRRQIGLFGAYARMLRSLRLLRVDVTKLNDEVTHISKFFGDWHLARVYRDAHERFYLDHWRNSVEDRLSQLDSLYTVVQADLSNQRMFWLEVIIVVFFAIDIVTLLFFK